MKQHESYYDYVERTSLTLNEMKNRLRDYEAEKKYNSQFDERKNIIRVVLLWLFMMIKGGELK